MDVVILATRGCSHYQSFSKELDDIGITHRITYAEDNPELCQSLAIRHSPNLIVDGNVIFRRQPDETELREFFKSIHQD